MSIATDMAEKHAHILGELADFGLNLARKLHGQAMAAETPEETANLAKAFHSVSRSVRQTLALEAKLSRDADRHGREFKGEHERAAQQTAQQTGRRRLGQVRKAVERAIWSEYEGDEAELLLEDLELMLTEEVMADGLAEETLEAQIARLCADLGLGAEAPPPERPRGPLNGAGQGPP